jgi:hypothetical protein
MAQAVSHRALIAGAPVRSQVGDGQLDTATGLSPSTLLSVFPSHLHILL